MALWACTKYEFVTKKTEFAFVHPGECGNCERHVVCPWTRKGREVKKEEKKGWRKWVSKVGSGLKKALEKTKNVVNKELHNFGKVCTFDGEEFKDRCQFMQARCKVFASKNIILAPAMKKMCKYCFFNVYPFITLIIRRWTVFFLMKLHLSVYSHK